MFAVLPNSGGQDGPSHAPLPTNLMHVSVDFRIVFPMSPYPQEMMQDFLARRHRAASRLACSSGKWSKLWARDVLSWHAHVQRGHDTHAWSPHVLNRRGHNWLRTQRLWNSAVGESRTNTRAYRGHVHRRWEDGVEFIASHQIL